MKAEPNAEGRVVISTQGHDKGVWYAVVAVLDERYVLVCDGRTRKLCKPKKKQRKHLSALPLTVAVTGKGASGGAIADSDLRASLKAARDGYGQGSDRSLQGESQQKEECAFVQERCY